MNKIFTSLSVWMIAARPKTLWASSSPVIMGCALALSRDTFHFPSAVAALICALLLQIGANISNDLYDHEKGADTSDRLGPLRVTQAGLVSPGKMRKAIMVVFSIVLLLGLYLVWRGGWPIIILGLASVLAALGYTGGPHPLGYHGLGEVFVFVFFGLGAVVGTYYVQALDAPLVAWLAALPMGFLCSSILVVNNLRDIETDRLAGKRTLAVRLGRQGTRVEYVLLIAAAFVTTLIIWQLKECSAGVLLTFAALPLAVSLCKTICLSTDGPTLNRALANTARLQFLYALLFSVGCLL